MLIRVATSIRDPALAERVRRALQVEAEPGDLPEAAHARRRFDSVVLTDFGPPEVSSEHAGHPDQAEHAGHAGHAGHPDQAEHAGHVGHVGHAGHVGHTHNHPTRAEHSLGDPGLLERLRRDPQDLVIALAQTRSDPDEIRDLVDQLNALPERTGLLLLHPDDDPRTHAALLGAGCLAALWTGLSSEGLAEALASLFERRRDETIARVLAHRPALAEPEPMVAVSPIMRELLETVRRVAVADSPVLVLGETGVGKERVAQLLHAWSPRSRGPFIALNCAAIPNELFESELFGHERGAFTGAVRSRRGQFELAHRGTLFLDEIAEIPLAQQAKLLRALQDKRIRPIGGDRELPVDVRVVAATNQDLREAMEAGRFRRDLFYRLGVVEIVIPPLRDRPDDIRELARRYAKQFATRLGRPTPVPDAEALARLSGHDWPGNVRELVNVMERAVLLSAGATITVADLPAQIGGPRSGPAPVSPSEARPAMGPDVVSAAVELPQPWIDQPWKQVREQLLLAGERAYLIGLLRASGGRIGDCARRAGIAERSLFEKMKRHGLRKEDFRAPS